VFSVRVEDVGVEQMPRVFDKRAGNLVGDPDAPSAVIELDTPTWPSSNARGYVRRTVRTLESNSTTTASAVRRGDMCAYGSMTRRR
jgi:hypothetical protein